MNPMKQQAQIIHVTVNELIRKGRDILQAYGKQDAGIDAKLLAMYLLECDAAKLLLIGNEKVADHVEQSYMYLIAKRVQGFPLQYITKEQSFMGLDFYVDERVLIPRQDTEVLVETLIAYSKEMPLNKGVEVGVGSGCISVSLAHYMEDVKITAIDICDQALEVAKKNILSNHVEDKVNLLQSDVFNNYTEEEQSLDFIVSNPPYITTEECKTLMEEVKGYEPYKALTDGGDGLKFYRCITKEGSKWLRTGGLLAYEIGYLQGESVCAILEAEGFEKIRIIKDLAGKDRVVLGIKK
ncbi:MAG: peptide chain release factor N(5)-glutamine methyltransferase [Cellulosilyticaceae bacterium]